MNGAAGIVHQCEMLAIERDFGSSWKRFSLPGTSPWS